MSRKVNTPEDSSIFKYFREADETFCNGFEDLDMQGIFLDNVFEEIKGHELKFCFIKSTSFIMDKFIESSSLMNAQQILKVANLFLLNFIFRLYSTIFTLLVSHLFTNIGDFSFIMCF